MKKSGRWGVTRVEAEMPLRGHSRCPDECSRWPGGGGTGQVGKKAEMHVVSEIHSHLWVEGVKGR